ncbi:MAG: hypothetical protein HXX80_00265 [Nitrososphaerales archaeon]|nr:hypothetical protein [Nitrososphaerales archaeon]
MNFDEPETGPLSVDLFNLMVGAYSVKEITNLIKRIGFVKVRELQDTPQNPLDSARKET